MKKTTALLSVALLMAGLVWPQSAKRDSTRIELGKGVVTIEYGAPSLNGRAIEDLIVPRFAWRIGMNEPTTLETTVDLEFYGRRLPAGKYVLFARPDESKYWVLVASSQTSGSVLDPSSIVLETPLQFTEADEIQDPLKISLTKSTISAWLTVAWGAYRLQTVFKAR